MKNIICHAKKERCITIGDYTLPLCSRCTGVYTGIVVGFLVGFWVLRLYEFSAIQLFYITLLFTFPTALDSGLQELLGRKSNNSRRLITGLLLGGIMGIDIVWLLLRIIRYQ